MPGNARAFDIWSGQCCHRPDYKLLTPTGLKKTSELKIGDKLFKDQTTTKITNLYPYNYEGNIYQITTYDDFLLEVTHDHPIYIMKNPKCNKPQGSRRCLPWCNHWNDCTSYRKKDLKIDYYKAEDLEKTDFLIIENKIERTGLDYSDEFLWCAGLFLADGSYEKKSTINIAWNKKQKNKIYYECLNKLKTLGKLNIYEYDWSPVVRLKVPYFDGFKIFGKYSHLKKLPNDWIEKINERQLLILWEGFEVGDGWHQKNVENGKETVSTASKELMTQFQFLFSIFGYGVSLKKAKNRTPTGEICRDRYILSVWKNRLKTNGYKYLDNTAYIKIKKIEKIPYCGPVIGIETECHYYSVPHKIHNCCHPPKPCVGMSGPIITWSHDTNCNNRGQARHFDITMGFCGHCGSICTSAIFSFCNNRGIARCTDGVSGCNVGVVVLCSNDTFTES